MNDNCSKPKEFILDPNWQASQTQELYAASVLSFVQKWLRNNGYKTEANGETLADICEQLVCPVWFDCAKLPYLNMLDIDLAKRPTTTPIFKEFFARSAECVPEGYCAFGLIFAWPAYGKFFVLHDLQVWPEHSDKGTFWRIGKYKDLIWLQPLQELLSHLFKP